MVCTLPAVKSCKEFISTAQRVTLSQLYRDSAPGFGVKIFTFTYSIEMNGNNIKLDKIMCIR